MARRGSLNEPVSDDAYERMDERIAAHFERVRSLLDDALAEDDR